MAYRKYFILMIITSFIFPLCTFAFDNDVYINKNNVSIPLNIYEKIVKAYSIGYANTMSQEEFDWLLSNGIDNIVVIDYIEPINLFSRGASHSTSNKSISIIKSGNKISLKAVWFNVPNTKAYDVIAGRFDNLSLKDNYSFKQIYKANGEYSTSNTCYVQKFSNGLGCSFKIANGTNHEIYLEFNISGSGTIYGSYQHAKHSTTLTESKNYTLFSSGLGRVVNFDSSVKDKYDGMGGVDLKV